MFLGDSLITPAISVFSAVEGLETVTPGLTALVVPISLTVLFALFLAQRFGTARIGGIFGPVMLLWFVAAAVFGLISLGPYRLPSPAVMRTVTQCPTTLCNRYYRDARTITFFEFPRQLAETCR